MQTFILLRKLIRLEKLLIVTKLVLFKMIEMETAARNTVTKRIERRLVSVLLCDRIHNQIHNVKRLVQLGTYAKLQESLFHCVVINKVEAQTQTPRFD